MPTPASQNGPDEALPFTRDDIATLDTWYRTMRLYGVRAEIEREAGDNLPEVAHVYNPFCDLYLERPTDSASPRWAIVRRADDVWADDLCASEHYGPGSMEEVLERIAATLEDDRKDFIADLPESLVPTAGT